MSSVIVVDSEISIVEKDGEFFVTSLAVAENFGKEHKNVLRDIENVECSQGFSRLNFEPSDYLDSRGKKQRMILMSRDGLSFLVMGFTGLQAGHWKERYINAFNSMERELTRVGGAAWALKRTETKLVRKPLTDAIKRFAEYAAEQGSESYKKNPALAYINFTKMEYKALFLLSHSVAGIRDRLGAMDLNTLSIAERGVRKTIEIEMENGTFYKDIYQIAKKKVESLAELVGGAEISKLQGNPFLEVVK